PERGLAPLDRGVGEHVGMARPERVLGLPAHRAFLQMVVQQDAQYGENANRGQTELEIGQAAISSRMRSASSMSTATTRDTPDSGMVTPISCCAISIEILLWLMKRNWVCADMRFTRSQKRTVLESSSGASTSSSRQNGAGLSWNMAKTSEIAVSAFSPPESRWMLALRLPGGCAITCTPASRISSPVMISFASPPPNSVGN